MKLRLLAIALTMAFSANLIAQTPISGIINRYTPVLGFECDTSVLLVGGTNGFAPGDLVLLIQMKGTTVNLDQNSSFGNILSTGTTGNFELNRIESMGTGKIALRYHVTRSYDIIGSVQLVRVPEYIDVTASNLDCQAWNGSTGGVLILDVSGTLNMQGNLDVSRRGFIGGQIMDTNNAGTHETKYFYPVNPDLAAAKGNGIATIPADHSFGRGKAANGGGGGNAHNAGGAGGGNAGEGGNGGLEYFNTPNQPTQNTNGIGGLKVFELDGLKAILGGGGGAGHSNDDSGVSGGNGGGIIIIRANAIQPNNFKLAANGGNVLSPGTNRNDGQGGAGAGGTIILQASLILDNLKAELKGGVGGDCLFYVNSQIIGPGGGGGGGKMVTNQMFPNLFVDNAGGLNGKANQNLSNGAQPGQNGTIVINTLPLPTGTNTHATEIDISFCPGDSVTIGGTVYSTPGTVLSSFVTSSGCDSLLRYNLAFNAQPTRAEIITFCQGSSVTLNGVSYAQAQEVIDTITSATACDTIVVYTLKVSEYATAQQKIKLCPGSSINLHGLTYDKPGIVIDTILALLACDTLLTTTIEWADLPTLVREVVLCKGRSITLGGISYSQPVIVQDTVPAINGGCDTLRTNILRGDEPLSFLPADTVICAGDRITLFSPYPNTYWNGAGPASSFDVVAPGLVIASAANPESCPRLDSIVIKTCCSDHNVYMPNVFSPNDDGQNDEFCLYATEQCAQFVLRVFDRWGALLFESRQADVCWDGTYRGRLMPTGVYVWIVAFHSDRTFSREILKGSVTLIR